MNLNTVFLIHFMSALVMVADVVATGHESFSEFSMIAKIAAVVFCLCFVYYFVGAIKGFLKRKTSGQ